MRYGNSDHDKYKYYKTNGEYELGDANDVCKKNNADANDDRNKNEANSDICNVRKSVQSPLRKC